MSYTMRKVPVRRYVIYPTPTSMFVVNDEPYFDIDDFELKYNFDTSYNLDKGYDELWYYVQSENIYNVEKYCGKKI